MSSLWHAPVLVAGGPGGDDAWSTLRLAHDSIAAGVMFGPAAVPREAFQLYQLVWPPGRPVAEAVRERGGAKAAVASGGRPARLAGFDEDDVPAGITFRRSWLPPSPLDRAAQKDQAPRCIVLHQRAIGPNGRPTLGARDRLPGHRRT
jgi:hypothetical protein